MSISLSTENTTNVDFDVKDYQIIKAISPSAEVTQTEDGATITITDKDGTTSAIIKNGIGEDGKTPEKGVDYFTDADKTEFTSEIETALQTKFDEKAEKEHTHVLADITDYIDDSPIVIPLSGTMVGESPYLTFSIYYEDSEIEDAKNKIYNAVQQKDKRLTLYTENCLSDSGTNFYNSPIFYNNSSVVGFMILFDAGIYIFNIDTADWSLSTKIVDITGTDSELRTLINTEISDRKKADTDIINKIDVESQTRESLDFELSNELEILLTKFESYQNAVSVVFEDTQYKTDKTAYTQSNDIYLANAISNILLLKTSDAVVDIFDIKNIWTSLKSTLTTQSAYYTDFATALTDMSNDTLDNGTSDSTNAVCQMMLVSESKYVNFTNFPMLKLLADVTVDKITIASSNGAIIDLNGHTLTATTRINVGNQYKTTYQGYIFYGKAEGSTVKTTSNLSIVVNADVAQFIYGNYIHEQSTKPQNDWRYGAWMYIQFTTTSSIKDFIQPMKVTLYGISLDSNITYETTAASIQASCIGMGGTSDNNEYATRMPSFVIEKCDIHFNSGNCIGRCINCGAGGMTYIKDSTIKAESNDFSETSGNDNAAIAVGCSYKSQLFVDNCTMESTNHSLSANDRSKIVVRNSILSGGVHGGLYSTTAEAYTDVPKQVYIQNCTIKKADKKLKQSYLYSCYISGDIHFDSCTFENEVVSDYTTPAIKKQSGQTISPHPYFSNCDMGKSNRIRIDSGCNAYFGKGMTEDMTIIGTGTLNRTDDTYAAIPTVIPRYIDRYDETIDGTEVEY